MRPTMSLTAVTSTFVPFAILLSVALLAAEQSDTLDHSRMIYASWIALGFAAVALSLFVFPRTRAGQWELLTWTFALAAYLVHFYYAFGVKYGFGIARTYAAQGPVIATNNFLVTALWSFDVAAGWFARRDARWLAIERVCARALVLVTFVTAAVIIFDGFVRVLGVAMVIAIVSCIAARVLERLARRGAVRASGSISSDATVS